MPERGWTQVSSGFNFNSPLMDFWFCDDHRQFDH